MKMPKLLRPKKFWVAAARRSASTSAETDYAELSEPNMKLSRALLIVLLLHVVAISGIIAFNVIKTRQSSLVPPNSTNSEASPAGATIQPTPNAGTAIPRPVLAQKQNALHEGTKPPDSAAKSVAADSHKPERARPVEHAKAPPSTGKTYTVVKGDNPVRIARKLKVSYEDLIALNHIDDPRKLKVGQKLLIPKSATTKKHAK